MYLEEIFTQYPYLRTTIWIIIIAATATTIERLTTRWLKKVIQRAKMPPSVGNGLILTGRLVILAGAIIALLHLGGVPPEIIVSFSALGGAAIGFASTRTIGNFIAGIFLLLTHPFRVGDYIRIDGTEGIVQEVSLNYTKILTPQNTIVSISMQRILDRDMTNFRISEESKLIGYGFEITFSSALTTEKIEETLDNVIQRYEEKLPKKPEYQPTRLTNFARHYMLYIYVEDPKDIFALQPQIIKEITQAVDKTQKQ